MTTRKRLTKIAVSLALAAMGLVFTPPFSSAQTVARGAGSEAEDRFEDTCQGD